jgi:LemA protein
VLVFLLFIVVLVVAVLLYAVSIYNGLIRLRNRIEAAWSQIDVQLKRRYDLIPNLVEAVKGYMAHERQTLDAVIRARNTAFQAAGPAGMDPRSGSAVLGLVVAEQALTNELGRFFGLAENYPQLKADQTVSRLMEELASAENRIAFARQSYNDAVMMYNTRREVFPSNLVASLFRFDPATLFRIDDARERNVVNVSLGS